EPLNNNKKPIIIVVLVLLVASLYLYGRIAVYPDLKKRPFEGLLYPNYVFLLLGVDHRFGSVRSDTMLLVHADSIKQFVDVVSLPRDTRALISGHGFAKLGHAFAYGGIKLARQTVEDMIGVKIDHTVTVNINGFEEIVDLLGGVTIEIEEDMQYEDRAQGLRIDLKKGSSHLSGPEAMQYVRFREKKFGDLGRLKRQQKFLAKMKKKLQTPLHLATLTKLLQTILSYVETDVSLPTLLCLVLRFRTIDRSNIRFCTLGGTPDYQNGVSYFIPNSRDIFRLRHLIKVSGRGKWYLLVNEE
ncbi:MAG: LCP family protein, partial [bacterium]|nr:LCP family protein [bacterium]